MIDNSEFTYTRYCINKLANYVGKSFHIPNDDQIFLLDRINLKFDTVRIKWENEAVDYSVERAIEYINDGLWIFIEKLTL